MILMQKFKPLCLRHMKNTRPHRTQMFQDAGRDVSRFFNEGDLVMVFLCKEIFLSVTYNKFKPKKYGPFKVLRKINENAYMIDLIKHFSSLNTFNISDIYEYY